MHADLILDRATILTMDPGHGGSLRTDSSPGVVRPARPDGFVRVGGPPRADGPLAGGRQGELGIVRDGALAIAGGLVAAVGPREQVLEHYQASAGVDLDGAVVTPGWVDAHTHPVWAGSRVDELEMRIAGAGYVEIAAAGGGIMSTVRATRDASRAELVAATGARLDALLAHGATTVEAKTGYGLSAAEEMRHLDVLAEASSVHQVHIVPTFLAAHAVPEEYAGRADSYVDLVVEEMLPALAARGGAFVDVFCDAGAFNLEQTRRILSGAAALGLPLKVHSDEFAHLGCSALAAELSATSADHLVAIETHEMVALAGAGTVAVLLPGTTLGLGSLRFAPAREFIANGVAVALGSDLNPGTCPSPNLPLIVAMACRYLQLSPAEALVAFTRNAAFACGRGSVAGRIAPGMPADLAVFETTDYRDIAYEFGTNPVRDVMIGGEWALSPGPRGPRV